MGKAFLMRAGTSLLQFLPARLSRRLANVAGDLCWALLAERRRVLEQNLRRTAPDADARMRRRLSRMTFRNLAQCTADLLSVPFTTGQQLLAQVESEDWHHLDEALALGRGVILVTGHVGNWDLAGICIAAAGYPAHAVVEPAEPVLARTYDRYRAATGVRTLPLGTGLLSAYRVLTQREVLLLVGDRAIGDTGCEVRFGLGRRRSTQGPAELACRSKAPVLIGYVVLNPDPAGPRYLGRIQPLVSEPAGDPAELTRLINDRLATIVGEYPDQWFVFQPDWIPEDS